MLALELHPEHVRDFMRRLLRQADFDAFILRTAEVYAASTYIIEGAQTWAEVRPLMYEIVKAGGRPQSVKLVFSHPAPEEIHQGAKALFLNLLYEGETVTFTTAVSQREFSLDRSMDAEWGEWVEQFFAEKGITVRNRE